MKISLLETFRTTLQPNVCVVRLTDDEGHVGLGETFFSASAIEAYLHDNVAPTLLRMTHASPSLAATTLAPYVGYQGTGIEVRALSAVDIALWDLVARRAGLPLRDILGGPTQDSVPVYNTCAGTSYVSTDSRQSTSNWGLRPNGTAGHGSSADHEDLQRFLKQPAALARELLDQGYRGMKVWPFDLAAEDSSGGASADLGAGLRVLDQIKSAVGSEMDLYLELHGLWTLRGATRLMATLADFDLAWVEDPLRPDSVQALTRLRGETSLTIASGETLCGPRGYLPLLEEGVLDVALVDLGWTGGLSAARRIADLADLHGAAVAPHDCAGPITLAAGLHWVTSSPNGVVQEMSRAFYHGWYTQIVDTLPPMDAGTMRPSDGPGLGCVLSEQFLTAPTTRTRSSQLGGT